jgi:FMN phosphatase YigB (HAD superfamily)
VRAVLLDVDGTLYHQNPLRLFMALELCALPLVEGSYQSASTTWKVVRAFRRVREELRGLGSPAESLDELQYVQTANRIGIDPAVVEQTIAEWIFRRPLKYLKHCRRQGAEAFFTFLRKCNVPVGVFSDYPVVEKLEALGLSTFVGPTLCATDSEINAFKPHPKGFLRVSAIWGIPPEEILYVGDRSEVDAVGAAAAGMPCAILSRNQRLNGQMSFQNCFTVSSFQELKNVLIDNIKR